MDVRKVSRIRATNSLIDTTAWEHILYHFRLALIVDAPEFIAVNTIVSRKIKRSAYVRQILRVTAIAT